MNENFYRQMMNRGFLIIETSGKFRLDKVPTPADLRPSITVKNDDKDGEKFLSEIEFDSWEEAFSKAELICQEKLETNWSVQMMAGHKLGVKIIDLEPVKAATWKEAKSKAEKLAVEHIENDFEKGSIETWEVKIKPFKE